MHLLKKMEKWMNLFLFLFVSDDIDIFFLTEMNIAILKWV